MQEGYFVGPPYLIRSPKEIKNYFCAIENAQLLKTHLNKNSFCAIRKIDVKNQKVPKTKPGNCNL